MVPILAVLAAAVCIRLSLWQFDRLGQRRARNAAARAILAEPPLLLSDTTDSVPPWRRVVAAGRWDTAHELVLRQQSFRGTPGVVLVTPLILAGGTRAVLVERGFMPSPDGMTLPDSTAPDSESGQVTGVALPIEAHGDSGRPLLRNGQLTFNRLDRDAAAHRVPLPIFSVVLRESDSLPGHDLPRRLAPPELDDGPHLSYAIQWIAFALIALVGAGVWLRQGGQGGQGGQGEPKLS
jgi:surfeit locus 1 family protein